MPAVNRCYLDSYLSDLCVGLGRSTRAEALRAYCSKLAAKMSPNLYFWTDSNESTARSQAMHHFVANAQWSESALLERAWRNLRGQLSDRIRYLSLDCVGIRRGGSHCVGVARQYASHAGRHDNCQVAITLSLVLDDDVVPMNCGLYLPREWMEASSRLARVGVPADVCYATRSQLATSRLCELLNQGVPARTVIADECLGDDEAFRQALDAIGATYTVAVSASTQVRKDSSALLAVSDLACSLPHERIFLMGTKDRSGRMGIGKFAMVRVRPVEVAGNDNRWLIVRWDAGGRSPRSYALSSLPADASPRELVQSIRPHSDREEDASMLLERLNLPEYDGRSWRGFHHHVALAMATYAFLAASRCRDSQNRRVMEHSGLHHLLRDEHGTTALASH
nr:IS701 family transposase [Roseateles oligotrophus]